MTDKKIIVAISSSSPAKGVIRFLNGYVTGENISITLGIFQLEEQNGELNDEVLDELSMLCITRKIPLKIKRLSTNGYLELKHLAAFSDLLVMEKSDLRHLAFNDDLIPNSCPVIALPNSFATISNILLISDGTSKSVQAKKQFYQTFPRWFGNPDVTLLSIGEENQKMSNDDELLLLDYLKQYSRNVGVLKVEEPLTSKILRPLRYDQHTIVVGTLDFLLSHYGEEDTFKPFFDNDSTLFLPALTA